MSSSKNSSVGWYFIVVVRGKVSILRKYINCGVGWGELCIRVMSKSQIIQYNLRDLILLV